MNPTDLYTETKNELTPYFEAMQIAEEEISAAQNRHPSAKDQIWRSFMLLLPSTSLLIKNELTYRSHCRELLDRVAAGADTRPATAAECCVALCETSLRVPLNTTAAGLYARMWKTAGLPTTELADASAHYEAIEGGGIDDAERELRAKLSQPDRRLASKQKAA
ncbi:hypothetical protein ACFY36_51035 [Actinoplanes sp. NPDC000266]